MRLRNYACKIKQGVLQECRVITALSRAVENKICSLEDL